ncbi:helix-turn-helix domain-containing protein [Bradyrhizobium septentrionale]|uniref:helix-turn-helix transcriptional regulator n=1 Tax=Bradyrhizobium septentrionale TaxID=1404411 RepID=UPI001CD5E234|nr:helix-turn-helix transcriptional regulator [Bradyrhizobium septentrionale]UGY27323.1 helix-turn-helix domain-containing protein [Bradyrhizobium septentrionale]
MAANLRRLRAEKGLAQDDLAYEAEVSRSYLSQLEKGAFYASLKILEKLARALGVAPYELIMPPKKRR